jgi:hypothetical protein
MQKLKTARLASRESTEFSSCHLQNDAALPAAAAAAAAADSLVNSEESNVDLPAKHAILQSKTKPYYSLSLQQGQTVSFDSPKHPRHHYEK